MLSIIYQDDHLIAINKPAGLLVHRSNIDRRETRFAVQLLRDQIGQRVYPIHRLDKPTSGVLLFAKDNENARRVSALFSGRQVKKRYIALVRGFTAATGLIDYPLKNQFDPYVDGQKDNPEDQPNHKEAHTHYNRLAQVELPIAVGRYASSRYSLLLLSPFTGRKHQLRRHLKHVFHPIVGDTTHGDGKHNHMFRQQLDCHRLLLAAVQLKIQHPHTAQLLDLRADPGRDFRLIMQRLGWDSDNCLAHLNKNL